MELKRHCYAAESQERIVTSVLEACLPRKRLSFQREWTPKPVAVNPRISIGDPIGHITIAT
jgi:hypothetical protein